MREQADAQSCEVVSAVGDANNMNFFFGEGHSPFSCLCSKLMLSFEFVSFFVEI